MRVLAAGGLVGSLVRSSPDMDVLDYCGHLLLLFGASNTHQVTKVSDTYRGRGAFSPLLYIVSLMGVYIYFLSPVWSRSFGFLSFSGKTKCLVLGREDFMLELAVITGGLHTSPLS
ncbi:hypothetical protein GDO81_026214 [Engystomops pustulosus]|uniref:Uncharacterized protein n=1 Tax=Engystomops pustulosus TaxID=76066 RepID=A0AAV6YK91_ENGPU|nr:hypothetical protein GDO81_026214 [Engystomops pustulosus]